MQQANAKRSGLLLTQFMFLETRQRAMEQAIYSLPFLSRIWMFFFPADMKEVVDRIHMDLWRQEQEKVKKADEKVKEEMSKPKLTIVGANGHVR